MPSIAESVASLVPAGVDVAQWLASRSALNSATGTVNQGVTKASGQLDTASQAAIDAQNKALEQQGQIYQTTVDANKPYQATGLAGNDQLQGLIKDPSSLTTTPGYQFELGQGLQGGQRAAAAAGTLGNGGTIKAQTRYALDYANTKYNDAVQRLLQVTNVGQTANAANQRAGETLGSQVGTGETNIGNFGTRNAEDQASLTLAQAQLAAKNQTLQGNNTVSTIGQVAPTILDAAKKIAPGVFGAAGAAGAGSSAAADASIAAGGAPIALGAGTTAADASIAAGGAPLAASGGTISSALGLGGGSGLLGLGAATIPVVGGIIAGGVLLANHFIGQGRKAADQLTGPNGIQRAFEETLNTIDSAPGQTEQQKWQAKEQAYEKLKELGLQFAQKGDKEKLVASQMFDEISHLFGDTNPLKGAA